MIFRPELVKKIAAGTKTQTRHRIKDARECRYRAGHSYAVQPGRGRPASFRITVLEPPRRERLGDMSLRDAKREGFRTTEEFRDYWRELYGAFDPDIEVWVITFVKGDVTDAPRLLAARPGPPSGDYTHDPRYAMIEEPEAVSARYQEQLAADAAEDDRTRRLRPIAGRGQRLSEELKALRAELPLEGASHRGCQREIARIEKALAKLREQLVA